MNVREHNKIVWNGWAEQGDRWSTVVSAEEIAAAKKGNWSVYLTESQPVPKDWFGDLADKEVLCLASGGGQQVPILAVAGAMVTSFDNSPKQLELDGFVAERERLGIRVEEGDMRSLARFDKESFDLIFHPCSNLFIPDVETAWLECFRVLKPAGVLLAGFLNPMEYIFDWQEDEEGRLEVKHSLPFSSLESQVGGQLKAGFMLADLFESYREEGSSPKADFFPSYIATKALKPKL